MNAKTLAHTIQVGLHTATGLDVKRSHVHELIAAAFGFGSQAAMLARGVLCPMPPALVKLQQLDGSVTIRRARSLGYAPAAADELGRLILAALDQDGLRLLPLDLVLSLLLDEQTALYGSDLVPQDDEELVNGLPIKGMDAFNVRDYADADDWDEGDSEEADDFIDLESEVVFRALQPALDRQDGRAHLALALLLEAQWEQSEFSNSGDGRYWYDREQKGSVLVGVEKEWADSYRHRSEAHQRADAHLNTAADLEQPDALLRLAERNADPRFFALKYPQVLSDPLFVARLAAGMGYRDAATQWLEKAAQGGELDAMRELILKAHATDPLKCWTWFHLAKLHGKDLTKSDYRALHENGSVYDDDVGGPMEIVGEDGVVLPHADETIRQMAEVSAREIYSR